MKRHVLIAGSATVVLLLAVSWWLGLSTLAAPPAPSTNTARPTPTEVKPATLDASPLPLNDQVSAKGKYQGLSDPRWKWWNEMEKKDPAFEWKMPINFYGKVIDQDGHSIAGVKVRFGWNEVDGSKERFDRSDARGLFSLTKVRGKIVSVRVKKKGYHAGSESFGSYEYAAFFESNYHEPSSNDPVIFRLVKKIDAEPFVVRNAFNSLSYDQGTYYYDLQRGTISRQPPAGAGLTRTIARSESPQGEGFDWTWTVEGVNTTVQATTDEFCQLAPTDGYMASWKTEQQANTRGFHKNEKAHFYLRTSDNSYGLASFELSQPNARSVGPTLSVISYLNPQPGSRNLEYDPSKDRLDGQDISDHVKENLQ